MTSRIRTGPGRQAPSNPDPNSQRAKLWKWIKENGPVNVRLAALRTGINRESVNSAIVKGTTQTPAWYREVDPPPNFPADLPQNHRGGRWVVAIAENDPFQRKSSPVEAMFAAPTRTTPADLRNRVAAKIAALTEPRDARWLAEALGEAHNQVSTTLSGLMLEKLPRVYRGESVGDKIRIPGSRCRTWHYLSSKEAWDLWLHGAPLPEPVAKPPPPPLKLPPTETLNEIIADSDSRIERMEKVLERERRQNRFLKAVKSGDFSEAPE